MKKKKRVLLLVESSGAYGRRIMQGVALYVREHEHWVLHVEDRGLFSIPSELLHGWNGDGIISRNAGGPIRKAIGKHPCPLVELLGSAGGRDIEVLPDERKSMELCIAHFRDRGMFSVAFYGFGKAWWVLRRRDLFQELTSGKTFQSHCFVDTSSKKATPQPPWEDRYEIVLKKWLKSLPHQTGLIVANDAQAIRVLNVCRQNDIKVPEQIALLGYDNDEHLCNLITPPLSSLDRNAEMVGYKAAELLDLKMDGKSSPAIPWLVQPRGVIVRRSSETTAIAEPDIAAALNYIAEFATQGIGINEVAEHVGLSRSTLSRLFQKYLNRSPKEEIIRIRLARAKYLLTYTEIPIKTIAFQSGYKTVEHFTFMFKQHTGQTPMTYRNESRRFSVNFE